MNSDNEAEKIMSLAGNDSLKALEILESQLNVLHTRGQVLVSLAGAAVTVTGFSGRIIAATNQTAQLLIISGLGTVLLSAFIICFFVMRVKWITSELSEDTLLSLELIIKRRDLKTKAYFIGGLVLCIGLLLYCCAVAIMLLNPEPLTIPAR